MQCDTAQRLRADPFDAKILLGIVVLFGLCIWWQLSDREPRSKEMTFAYRKHFESKFRELSPKEQIRLRNQNHTIELMKTNCEKIEANRYRCDAEVRVNDALDNSHPLAEHGLYVHDEKGWQYAVMTP